MAKKSDHIRVRPEDKAVWSKYCKDLSLPSPDLFKKVMNSENLKLNEKILQELRKKEEDLRRKLNLYGR